MCPISTSDYIKDVVSFCPESRVVQLTNMGSDSTKIPSYESAKLSHSMNSSNPRQRPPMIALNFGGIGVSPEKPKE